MSEIALDNTKMLFAANRAGNNRGGRFRGGGQNKKPPRYSNQQVTSTAQSNSQNTFLPSQASQVNNSS